MFQRTPEGIISRLEVGEEGQLNNRKSVSDYNCMLHGKHLFIKLYLSHTNFRRYSRPGNTPAMLQQHALVTPRAQVPMVRT